MMHEDVRCLIKRGAHHLVTAAADMPIVIDLPGAVATWCQAKMSTNISRAGEALRHVDTGPICERHDHTHTRYCHEAAADGITASNLQCHAIQTTEFF